MERKFIKKSAPFGQGQPPGGGAPRAPGQLNNTPPAPSPQGAPQNSAPGATRMPSNAPQPSAPSPTPQNQSQAPQQPPRSLTDNSGPKPRTPDAPGGSGIPTDVHVDMATGNISIKKGPVNITFAKLSFNLSEGLKKVKSMVEANSIVGIPEGLHARPASQFVRAMKQFESEITVTNESGKSGNAKSAMSIMMLGAMQGSTVTITANGPDEQEALDAALQILEGGEITASLKKTLAAKREDFDYLSDWIHYLEQTNSLEEEELPHDSNTAYTLGVDFASSGESEEEALEEAKAIAGNNKSLVNEFMNGYWDEIDRGPIRESKRAFIRKKSAPYEGQTGWSEFEQMPGGSENPIDPETGEGMYETPVYTDKPSNYQEEVPPVGKFSPGESVKVNDPKSGYERYGFIVKLTEDGMYEVNFDDGTTRKLHEGWIMDAPEAPNSGDPGNYGDAYQNETYASLRDRFFKAGTHQDYIDFKENDNEPQYGDWKEETEYSKEYHENPFSNPKNRLTPPTFDVKATVPDYQNARSIAYSLQVNLNKDVDVSGQTLTIKDVEQPLSLITELSEYGIEAKTTEDLTKFDQGIKDFKQGMKVAMVGDFPDMNYYYGDSPHAVQAMVIDKEGEDYILQNNIWGQFKAKEWELDYVRS